MDASIIIRTYNEARWLGDALDAVARQTGVSFETILVDSGSDDGTVDIAEGHGCRIERIEKSEFTFGRSLNRGCAAAKGDVLVFLSGHCIPTVEDWLQRLIDPIGSDGVVYTYGRQIGRDGITKFSEEMLFQKYFPAQSSVPQDGFFCNNANSALDAETWRAHPFDEEVTGLEDLVMAKALVEKGHAIGYVAEAPVEHIHEETWPRVTTRYEREALAMQKIMPEVRFGLSELIRYTSAGIWLDFQEARRDGTMAQRGSLSLLREIVRFRTCQYFGTYRGARQHRKVSREMRERYYYPR
ncbi:MAG: glycosyltransferase family 2 protein [Pseudomonadota bacterium]